MNETPVEKPREADSYDLVLNSAGPRPEAVARVLRQELPQEDVDQIMASLPTVALERVSYATAEGFRMTLSEKGAEVELLPVYVAQGESLAQPNLEKSPRTSRGFKPPQGHSEFRIAMGYVGASLVILGALAGVFVSKRTVSGWVYLWLPILALIAVVKIVMRRRIWRVLLGILVVLSVSTLVKVRLGERSFLAAFRVTCPQTMKLGDTEALSATYRGEPVTAEWDVTPGSGRLGLTFGGAQAGSTHLDWLDLGTAYFHPTATGSVWIKVTGLVDAGSSDMKGPYLDQVEKACEILVTSA